jgi:hypothetical protein
MIPKPQLDASIQTLADRDEYKVIIGFIRQCREQFFADFRQAENANDVMKVAGSIAALDELLAILDT